MDKLRGDERIRITLTARLENGEIFEEISEEQPLEFTLGTGALFPALEKSLIGMGAGETRTVRIPAEHGYGHRHKDLVHTIDRSVFTGRINPKPGMILALSLETNGRTEQVPATVLSVDSAHVVVDYNHPLAGEALHYTVTLLKILTPE